MGNQFLVSTSKFGLALLLVTVSMLILFNSQAYAITGSIAYAGCIGHGVDGCRDISPATPIYGAKAVAVSPDGSSVYVISGTNNFGSVAHFRREINGDLIYAGCVGQNVAGCTDIHPNQVLSQNLVSITALKDSVYVISSYTIGHFRRNPETGDIAFAGCIGGPGCRSLENPYMQQMTAVTASSDGRSIYAISEFSRGGVLHFQRNAETGDISFAGCTAEGGMHGCRGLGSGINNVIDDPSGLVVSMNGRSLYVVSYHPGSIAHYRRNLATGDLSYAGCIGNRQKGVLAPGEYLSGCTAIEGENATLGTAKSVAVSPDDRSVYVVQPGGVFPTGRLNISVIHHFRRAENGDIAHAGCIGSGMDICRDINPPIVVIGARSVVAYSDSVYVASDAPAVLHFERRSNGDLRYDGCVGESVRGCRETGLNVIHRPNGLAISPDARSVYLVSGPQLTGRNGVVLHFRVSR
jgi:DNA-binding beta-propeller fold protein YncE